MKGIRPQFVKVLAIIAVCACALFWLLDFFLTQVTITPPMMDGYVYLTRNGQEVLESQVESVKFLLDEKGPNEPADIQIEKLREARFYQGGYLVDASYSIYRYKSTFRSSTEIVPEYHSLFLRIVFTDGQQISVSYPVLPDTREIGPIFIDVSESVRR